MTTNIYWFRESSTTGELPFLLSKKTDRLIDETKTYKEETLDIN